MLILTRKIGETLLIGENIRLVVLEVRGKQIRLGIDAPPDVPILREEILHRLILENGEAAAFRLRDLEEACRLARRAIPRGAIPPSAQPATIPINTREFGQVMVSEDEIINFPKGLPGFSEFHRYALIEQSQTSPFLCLQCLDKTSLAFVAAEPRSLVTDYRLGPSGSALQELEARDLNEIILLVLLTIPPGQPQEMTANLSGPILINPGQRRGKQILVENSRYSQKYPLLPKGESPA